MFIRMSVVTSTALLPLMTPHIFLHCSSPHHSHRPQWLRCLAALRQLSNIGRFSTSKGESLETPPLISVRYFVNPYEICDNRIDETIPVIPKPAMEQTLRWDPHNYCQQCLSADRRRSMSSNYTTQGSWDPTSLCTVKYDSVFVYVSACVWTDVKMCWAHLEGSQEYASINRGGWQTRHTLLFLRKTTEEFMDISKG
jgi:hypothetical protein